MERDVLYVHDTSAKGRTSIEFHATLRARRNRGRSEAKESAHTNRIRSPAISMPRDARFVYLDTQPPPPRDDGQDSVRPSTSRLV